MARAGEECVCQVLRICHGCACGRVSSESESERERRYGMYVSGEGAEGAPTTAAPDPYLRAWMVFIHSRSWVDETSPPPSLSVPGGPGLSRWRSRQMPVNHVPLGHQAMIAP